MAELSPDARIRDLKRRLDLDPGSRLFVTLAEEYRKTGLLAEALSTLQRGLLAHPNYLSAHVALGRAYLEAGQITEAIATFTRVLASDPGNLVSAKSLADIFLSRGEGLEAIKKYKLYRALSGDRTVDDIVERLQVELAPPPPPARVEASLPPPPTFFGGKPTGPIRTSRDRFAETTRRALAEPADPGPLSFDPEESTAHNRPRSVDPFPVLSRDIIFPSRAAGPPATEAFSPPPAQAPPPAPVAGLQSGAASAPPAANAAVSALAPPPRPDASDDVATRAFRVSDVLGGSPARETAPRPTDPSPFAPRRDEHTREPVASGPSPAPPDETSGRTLADLYFAQGHYTEALRIYDDLVAANPHDLELKRLRRDAEARLLPAGSGTSTPSGDAGLTRRLAKVRALKQWLSMVQTG